MAQDDWSAIRDRSSFAPAVGDPWWLRLPFGATAAAVGAGLLVWPDTTIRVLGILFGLNLLVSGVTLAWVGTRGTGMPSAFRAACGGFAGLEVAVAIICLRHPVGATTLLVVLVGLELLVDGATELVVALYGTDRSAHRPRFVAAASCLIGGATILGWPALNSTSFVVVAGLTLVALGVREINAALGLARDLPEGQVEAAPFEDR